MNCKIEYVGKLRNGKAKYWCLTHKSKASDKEGNQLKRCLSSEKEFFQKGIRLDHTEIKSIKVIFPNLLEDKSYRIWVNDIELPGVLYLENSILEPKNFIGLLLSKLNHIELVEATCSHCNHLHNDNELFAITPHRKHLCHYCGHEFYCKEANVGSELIRYFKIPEIKLNETEIEANGKICLTYDILQGKILINDIEAGHIFTGKDHITIREWLTKTLK